MTNIHVHAEVLSGNLGSGWDDENEAATELARLIKSTWKNDLAQLSSEGHEFEIFVVVRKNTTGYAAPKVVFVSDDTVSEEYVRSLLTDEQVIFEKFLRSLDE